MCIVVVPASSEGFWGSTTMETERVGQAGPTRILFVPFRDGGNVVGYPLGHAKVGGGPLPVALMWRGVFFGMLFCTTSATTSRFSPLWSSPLTVAG